MLICTSCGHGNGEGAKFCEACGLPVATTPTRTLEQRKTVTIVFCDIAGSTEIADRSDPEVVRAMLAQYYARMREVIERHGGTVEKFIGDAVMAVFGVPVVHEDDALRAVRSAVDMRDALVVMGIAARIGVNTGEVVAHAGDSLVTGDVVNVAARLEQAAEAGQVLVGPDTARLVRDEFELEPAGPLDLKGKSDPVSASRVLGAKPGRAGPEDGRHRPAMVARETELRRLRDTFDQAVRDSSCQLFTILGVAGVGKSRLVSEFVTSLEGATVVRGRCLSYGEGITYWPMVEVVRQLPSAGELGLDDAAVAAIASMTGERDGSSSTEEIAWAVRKLLERVASTVPCVVVFDDIHWAEPTFLDAIEHVADLSRGAPILVVCMARPDLIERRPHWSGGKVNATMVLLEPLSTDETRELVARLMGRAAGDDALQARIGEAAEGNPLFAEEIVALARESGASDITVPPTIQALLAARLDQVDPAERQILEIGSVEGRVFQRAALDALSTSETELTALLAGLVRKELIRSDPAQDEGDDAYRFRHVLIREAAYNGITKARRADLHDRFATWLERRQADRELDEIIGYHLEKAYWYLVETQSPSEGASILGQRAAERLAAGGHRALSRGDLAAGSSLLERAVDILPADHPWRPALLLDLGSALIPAGEFTGAENALTAAVDAAATAGDPRTEHQSAVALAGVRTWMGARSAGADEGLLHEELLHTIERAIGVFDELGDDLGLARAYKWLAEVHNQRGSKSARTHALDEALEHAHAAGSVAEEGEILTYLPGAMLFDPTPATEAIQRLEELRSRPAAGVAAQVVMLASIGGLHAMLGEFDEGDRHLSRSLQLGEEFGLTFQLARAHQTNARARLIRGDAAGAERDLRWAYEAFGEMGEVGRRSTVAAQLADAICEQARYTEAEDLVDRLRDAGDFDVDAHVDFQRVMAKLLAQRGQLDDADRLAAGAVETFERSDGPNDLADALIELARVLTLGDHIDRAVQATERAISLYEQKEERVLAEQGRLMLDELRSMT